MYRLSRALLQLAVCAGIFTLVIATIMTWPISGIGIGFAIVARMIHGRRKRLTTLGSARFAEVEDLSRAGMLDAKSGLILGRTAPVRAAPTRAVSRLWSRQLMAREACEAFFKSLKAHKRLVRLNKAVHLAVFAPTGAGKNVSFITPFLKTCPEATVQVDFKGELTKLTAKARRHLFRQQIVVLDPYLITGIKTDCFNPLDFISKDSPYAIDAINDLAKALVVRAPDERELHWNDSAELHIAGVTGVVVAYGEAGQRSLQTVREILCSPQRLDMAIEVMCESDAFGGMLARIGGQLTQFEGKEKNSVLTTVSRHLKFLDTPAIAACTNHSGFDPSLLRKGQMSIYLVLPPEHMRANIALLRLWVSQLFQAIIKGGLQEENKVHFILDEAASLSGLECIEDAVDKYRGFGIRLQFYYQSLGQLQKCFPNGQDQTLLSNTTQIFLAVNDNSTAEFVSQRLGEETIVLESGGTSRGTTWQPASAGQTQGSYSYSSNSNHNWQQQARKLLKPEEVMALHPRVAITFTPGVPPICTELIRSYEEPMLGLPEGKLQQFGKAAITLVKSVLLLVISVGIAILAFAAATNTPISVFSPHLFR